MVLDNLLVLLDLTEMHLQVLLEHIEVIVHLEHLLQDLITVLQGQEVRVLTIEVHLQEVLLPSIEAEAVLHPEALALLTEAAVQAEVVLLVEVVPQAELLVEAETTNRFT